jgi:hypothetical protein
LSVNYYREKKSLKYTNWTTVSLLCNQPAIWLVCFCKAVFWYFVWITLQSSMQLVWTCGSHLGDHSAPYASEMQVLEYQPLLRQRLPHCFLLQFTYRPRHHHSVQVSEHPLPGQ